MLRRPNLSDWEQFYRLTANEGWRIPQVERHLFKECWAHDAQVLDVGGNFAGLVTAVAHEQSGWIGNLIVPPLLRNHGYGSRLFQAALDHLVDRGLSQLWLTASALGQPLYEKSGFVAVDRIERWVSARRAATCSGTESRPADETLRNYDRRAWGEDRTTLLNQLFLQGQLFACDDSVALLQRGTDLQIIGPWYSQSHCPRANRQLLLELLATADPNIEVVIDLLISSPLRQLLVAAGFARSGETVLMMRGKRHATNLATMVSLASLGSFG